MTTTYDTFLPEVLPYAPNCTELVAINAIRNAVIEFCTDSWYWQHDCFPQPGSVNVGEYQPDLPDNTKLLGIINAWYNGKPMHPQDNATLRRRFPYGDYRDAQGQPAYWQHVNPDTLLMIPKPDTNSAGKPLTMRVAVAPLRSSTGCLDNLYERYAEMVATGALARLKATPDQPYSDPAGAVLYLRQFRADVVKVRAEVERGKTRGPIRVRYNGRNGA